MKPPRLPRHQRWVVLEEPGTLYPQYDYVIVELQQRMPNKRRRYFWQPKYLRHSWEGIAWSSHSRKDTLTKGALRNMFLSAQVQAEDARTTGNRFADSVIGYYTNRKKRHDFS